MNATRQRRPASNRDAYRALTRTGLTAIEAGNVTALKIGLRPVTSGWTIAELDRLLFLRHLVDRGLLKP